MRFWLVAIFCILGLVAVPVLADGGAGRRPAESEAFDRPETREHARGSAVAPSRRGYVDNPFVSIAGRRVDTTGELAASVLPGWTAADADARRRTADPYVLLKLAGPVGSGTRRQIEESGYDIVAAYPYSAFLVRARPGASAAPAGTLPGVTWVGRFHPYYKIGPAVARAVEAAAPASLEAADAEWGLRFTIGLHGGSDRGVVAGKVAAIPGVLRSWSDRGPLRVRVDPATFATALASIAAEPDVAVIEPWHRPRPLNDENVQAGQSGLCNPGGPEAPNTVIFNRGLTGWNARVVVADTCVDANEGWFYDDLLGRLPAHETDFPWTSQPADWAQRKIVEYYDMYSVDTTMGCAGQTGGFKDHGTKVAGVAAGNCSLDPEGVASATNPANTDGDDDGMAPGAKVVIQDLGNGNLAYLSNGGTLGELITVAHTNTCDGADCGIDIHTNSWGVDTDAYGTDARTGDAALWSLREPVVFVAMGNTGPGPGTVHDPATSKNAVGVGSALDCSTDDLATSSSRGDSSDGRLKPDIVLTGVDVHSALNDGIGDTNVNGGCSTEADDGTSFAAPSAAGLAALVHQYFEAGFYPDGAADPADSLDPSGALLKAMLINTARPMQGSGAAQNGAGWPNMDQGYGYVVLEDALHFDGDSRDLWVHDELVGVDVSGPASLSFRRGVASSTEPLKVTLAWYDREFAGSCGGLTPCLLNDLDLTVVEEATGTSYTVTLFEATPGQRVPRTLVPSSPGAGQTTVDSGPDDLNTVEQIIVHEPLIGTNYTFRVTAANTPDGPIPFALVATGGLAAPCEPMAPPPNNTAVDLEDCVDSGVLVGWAKDVMDWGDAASADRGYRVLRDGVPVLDGGCSGRLPYGTTSCVDDTGPDDTTVTYRIVYENSCNASVTTAGAAAMDEVPPIVAISVVGDDTVCPGDTVTFGCSVDPPEGVYAYQWTEDGVLISGEITDSLAVAKGSVESHVYNCRVTDFSDFCAAEAPVPLAASWTVSDPEVVFDTSLDPATTLVEACGDGDAVPEPGEFWEVTPRLANLSTCATAYNARADLVVNPSSVVQAASCAQTGYFGTVPPTGTASHTYTFQVDPAATCGEDIDFDLQSIWWRDGTLTAQTAAFSIQAGESAGASETATQVTDPLDVSLGQGFSSLSPSFVLLDPLQAQLDYLLGCDFGPLRSFSSSSFNSLSGWTVTGDIEIDNAFPDTCTGGNGNYARFIGPATLTRNVSTARYKDVRIRADFSGAEAYSSSGECFEWLYSTNGGSNWVLYKSFCGSEIPDGTWTCDESFQFPPSADDNPDFRIRFRTTGDVDIRIDDLHVEGIGFPCAVKDDVKVELIRSGSGGGVFLIKDLGEVDPQKPIDVTDAYNDPAGGPGLWLLRMTESVGGTARMTFAVMSLSEEEGECDLTASCTCPVGPPGEVSDDPAHFLTVTRNGSNVDLVFEDLGATSYNVYVSTQATTLPFQVGSGPGKRDCSVAISAAGGGTLLAADYDVEDGILVPSDVFFIIVTADDGGANEGPLGYTSDGVARSATAGCSP